MKLKYVLRYMVVHAVAVSMAFANGMLCYKSKVYHSGFCLLILAAALWNGSTKYYKIMYVRAYARACV